MPPQGVSNPAQVLLYANSALISAHLLALCWKGSGLPWHEKYWSLNRHFSSSLLDKADEWLCVLCKFHSCHFCFVNRKHMILHKQILCQQVPRYQGIQLPANRFLGLRYPGQNWTSTPTSPLIDSCRWGSCVFCKFSPFLSLWFSNYKQKATDSTPIFRKKWD